MSPTHPTPVPLGTPFTVTLLAEQWIAIGDLLGTLPWVQANPILTSIGDQHKMQLLAMARETNAIPTPRTEELKAPMAGLEADVEAGEPEILEASLSYAKGCLRIAEAHRRQDEGSMNVSPLPEETVDDDYAVATVLISAAMHHLDEALPSGQEPRASNAFTALEEGTRRLRLWLERRGVNLVRAYP